MQAEGYVCCNEQAHRRDRCRGLTAELVLQINLKNTWAKAIDTIQAKNTAGSDLSNFVVCYPGSLAPRIAVLKVGDCKPTPTVTSSSRICLSTHQRSGSCLSRYCATCLFLVLQVLIKKEKQDVKALEQAPQGAPADVGCHQATFKSPVKAGATIEFDVVATVTGVFKPNPAKIGQGEKQYVEYYDNLYLLSPYEVTEQSSTVSCCAATAASVTSVGALCDTPAAEQQQL
eukprot:GHRQ01025306.1.p1 GENE.GHRQ01025306.1~~GHRQ01025306.1.p1  ORF type:complete len:230 (+),score=50.88 GHRQ01025306.1:212-901(+)